MVARLAVIGVAVALVSTTIGATLPLAEFGSCGLGRLVSGQAPPCCGDQGPSAISQEGGGCCRLEPLQSRPPALFSSAVDVPAAPLARLAARDVAALLGPRQATQRRSAWPPGVPPPAEPPTETVVLLL